MCASWCVTGSRGLPEAIGAVWELAIVQTCVIHLIRNTFRYASRRYWDQMARDLRPVYTASSEAAAKERWGEFAGKWGQQYPAIIRLWDNAWSEFVPFLDYGACRIIAPGPDAASGAAPLRSEVSVGGLRAVGSGAAATSLARSRLVGRAGVRRRRGMPLDQAAGTAR